MARTARGKPLDGPQKPLDGQPASERRACENCNKWLSDSKRSNARFCDDACRYEHWVKETYGSESNRTAARKQARTSSPQ